MLLDSITNSQADIKLRAIVEAKTEAEQLIQSTENFIHKNESFLHPQEIVQTKKQLKNFFTH